MNDFAKNYQRLSGPNGLQRLKKLAPDSVLSELETFERAVVKLQPFINAPGETFAANDTAEINEAIADSHVPVWALSQLSFVKPGLAQAALICQKAILSTFNDANDAADLLLLEAADALGDLALAIINKGKASAKESDLLPLTIIDNLQNRAAGIPVA
jgi:hypothetical protein